MIFTEKSANCQINSLLCEYPNLKLVDSNSKLVHLKGSILVNRHFNKFILCKNYNIDVFIPIESYKLPYVVDSDKYISRNYHHYYSNGELCLATDTQIMIRFLNGFDLVQWMKEYVEIYFLSYEYFQRFGEFPFGERQHGCIGILETYQDLFFAKDLVATFNLMKYIVHNSYRGHHICPCGSGKRLRKCHGEVLLEFYKNEKLRAILLQDFDNIVEELKNDKKRRNI